MRRKRRRGTTPEKGNIPNPFVHLDSNNVDNPCVISNIVRVNASSLENRLIALCCIALPISFSLLTAAVGQKDTS